MSVSGPKDGPKKSGRRSDFREAMADVKPLAGRDDVRPPPPRRRAPRPESEAAPRFEVERSGERIADRAAGVPRAQLRRLRRGEIPVDAEVDLHRLDRAAAQRALREAIRAAAAAGERCVLVVHGRGLHSQGGAVLKRALVDWLQAPPLAAHVLAFGSADPDHGGAGATYVLLRRPRRLS